MINQPTLVSAESKLDPAFSAPIFWKGIVAIERPEPTKALQTTQPMCRVISARTQLGGMRAIAVELPYAMVKHKFRLEDGDSCYCYAELIGDHLEIYERATQREFFLHPEQHSLRTGVLQGY